MDAQTLEALKGSIRKWDKSTRVRKATNVKIADGDCPLCHLYHPKLRELGEAEACDECPVKERSGGPYCLGTPYIRASRNLRTWNANLSDGSAFRSAAIAERDFLISLLPEGETWK